MARRKQLLAVPLKIVRRKLKTLNHKLKHKEIAKRQQLNKEFAQTFDYFLYIG